MTLLTVAIITLRDLDILLHQCPICFHHLIFKLMNVSLNAGAWHTLARVSFSASFHHTDVTFYTMMGKVWPT